MARQIRIQFAGAIYPGMNRGDRREALYQNDEDHRCFPQTLEQAYAKTEWEDQADCLMAHLSVGPSKRRQPIW